MKICTQTYWDKKHIITLQMMIWEKLLELVETHIVKKLKAEGFGLVNAKRFANTSINHLTIYLRPKTNYSRNYNKKDPPNSGRNGKEDQKMAINENNISENSIIDDHTAELVLRMAKKFYSDPKNVKKFEEWHLKEYGCLPGQGGKHNGK